MAITDSFAELAAHWEDKPEVHDEIIHAFDKAVVECEPLKQQREWCEKNSWGFGHRAFSQIWRLFVKEAPQNFKFLELGVFRGQSLSTVALCSILEQKQGRIFGVSPFDGSGGYYEIKRYEDDVNEIFKRWTPQLRPELIVGLSLDKEVVEKVRAEAPFDGIYIDSDHSFEVASKELPIYTKLVKPGGFLFVDDCGFGLTFPDWFFYGFEGISKAVNDILPPTTKNLDWKFIGNIMHLRIYRKIDSEKR